MWCAPWTIDSLMPKCFATIRQKSNRESASGPRKIVATGLGEIGEIRAPLSGNILKYCEGCERAHKVIGCSRRNDLSMWSNVFKSFSNDSSKISKISNLQSHFLKRLPSWQRPRCGPVLRTHIVWERPRLFTPFHCTPNSNLPYFWTYWCPGDFLDRDLMVLPYGQCWSRLMPRVTQTAFTASRRASMTSSM